MARVLIAGCGYVGSALAERLADGGHAVWGLRREPDGLPSGVAPLVADLTEPETLGALPSALDYVFYTAAADGSSDEAYRAAYVDGVANLLSALSEQGQQLRRVLFTSSTGVYGQSDGEWVDESSPTEPAGFSGRRVLEGEQVLHNGPFPAVVLRLGGIYGPGRTRLIRQVRDGSAACPPPPGSYSNRIHRDDCAGALHHLMQLANPDPVYIGADREPADLCEVLHWLAARLGVPPPPTERSAADSPMRRRSNKRCSSGRLVASGYRFRFPSFREGFESEILLRS